MRVSRVLILTFWCVLVFPFSVWAGDPTAVPPVLPVPGMVTLIDLGATKCIPCKMMAPLLAELSREYEGKAAVVFLDVRQTPPLAKKFKIRSIPTQIFYDRSGKEIFRHEGFFDKEGMKGKIEEILALGGPSGPKPVVMELPVQGLANVIMIDDSAGSDQAGQRLDMLSEIQTRYADRVKVIYSDIRKRPEIASRLKVAKAPVFLFFDPSGKEVFRFQGLMTRDQIVDVLTKMNIRARGQDQVMIPDQESFRRDGALTKEERSAQRLTIGHQPMEN